jgi:hypothetical protein
MRFGVILMGIRSRWDEDWVRWMVGGVLVESASVVRCSCFVGIYSEVVIIYSS